MNKKTNKIIGIFLLQGDFVFFFISLYLALFLRGMPLPQEFRLLQLPFLHIFFICVFIFFIMDLYDISIVQNYILFLRDLLIFAVFASLCGFAYFYFQPQLELTPRAIIFLTILVFTAFSAIWRYMLFSFIGMQNFRKKVLFIGASRELKEILTEDNITYEFKGVYAEDHCSKELDHDIPVIKDVASLKKMAGDIEVAVFTSHTRKDREVIAKIFNTLPLNIKYMDFSTLYEEIKRKIPLFSVDDWWFLENVSRPRRRLNDIFTRIFELFFSAIGLTFTVILSPFIALLIKADSRGPILYRQKRLGKLEKPFWIYKFRTMDQDAESNGPQWSAPGDNRVTRTGKILRKLHLDELPQFYNILKGDISFVGPRPERPYFIEKLKEEIPYYDIRHLEKPGLTGWAQLYYPASSSVEEAKEKFKYELYYIKNRSFLFDMVILLKTLRSILHLGKRFN